jgi:hypothetical protein
MSDQWTDSRTPEELLFTDRQGNPIQVQEVMGAGLDGGYEDRIPALVELMEHGEPAHRLYACMILTAWGDERGFSQIIEWARDPDHTPWAVSPVTVDRFYGVDFSFASLADAVRTSFLSESAPSIANLQMGAIKALLGISSHHYMDRNLAIAIAEDSRIEELVVPAVRSAVEAAIARLGSGEVVGFDLGFQTASLLSVLAPVDDVSAARYADELAHRFRTGERMLKELAGALGYGTGPATARALHALRALRLPGVEQEVDAAFALRAQSASS